MIFLYRYFVLYFHHKSLVFYFSSSQTSVLNFGLSWEWEQILCASTLKIDGYLFMLFIELVYYDWVLNSIFESGSLLLALNENYVNIILEGTSRFIMISEVGLNTTANSSFLNKKPKLQGPVANFTKWLLQDKTCIIWMSLISTVASLKSSHKTKQCLLNIFFLWKESRIVGHCL